VGSVAVWYPRRIYPIDLLIAFLVLLTAALAVTMILNLVVLRVPYIPTSPAVAREMVRFAGLTGTETIMDLGAGDGRVLIEALHIHPRLTAIGIEYVPTVWMIGKLLIRWHKVPAELRLGDALKADVSKADVIFLYMSPNLMKKLQKKFDAELPKGTPVISHTFRFEGREPAAETAVGKEKIRKYIW
jgi:precorrin-6B methylase 2